jgi:hypothetical protein
MIFAKFGEKFGEKFAIPCKAFGLTLFGGLVIDFLQSMSGQRPDFPSAATCRFLI